jgi:hypothetical protein
VSTGDSSEIVGPGWHLSSAQAKHAFGRISQVLTAAIVLAIVCLLEIAVLQVLIGEGVAALNAT